MAHDWVAEARLGVVQENRASLGALVVLTDGACMYCAIKDDAHSRNNCGNT